MLKDFDFFEHLNTHAEKTISLEELNEVVSCNTYESCYLYYRSKFTEDADGKNSLHIIKLKEFLYDPDFLYAWHII